MAVVTGFVCPNPLCGQRSLVPGWCQSCAKRKNYVQVRVEADAGLQVLSKVRADDVPRLPIPEWPGVENALHGGFVLGSVTALYGDPGAGKSTLALQLADAMASLGPSGYLSSEQLVPHVKLTAVRVGLHESPVLVGAVNIVEEVEAHAHKIGFRFLVVDSLHNLAGEGTTPETTRRLVALARARRFAMLLVLHVTTEGDYSGPRAIEHEVDCMTRLACDEAGVYRLDVIGKYRYGPVPRSAKLGRRESGGFFDWQFGPF